MDGAWRGEVGEVEINRMRGVREDKLPFAADFRHAKSSTRGQSRRAKAGKIDAEAR
jgi:hypothetical protein